ncbi:MAG: WecB/TagA/CpsF family glycosyltransferase [Rhizobiaceae bacterium]
MGNATDTILAAGTMESDKRVADHRIDCDTHNILGVKVWAATSTSAVRELERVIDSGEHRKLSFLNAHGANIAYKNANYREILRDFTVLSDGVGLDLGAQILYGAAFPENLNGTDFVPKLFNQIRGSQSLGRNSRPDCRRRRRRIALLGAKPGVAEAAAQKFAAGNPQHDFTVVSDGYFDSDQEIEILDRLKAQRPDILLVALGNPIQEEWIAKHCTGEHAAVCIGVGALLDFSSGIIPRAPQTMIRWRLEWLFRLGLEPKRMWRRYVVGNPLFIKRILRQKFFGPQTEPNS